MRRAVSIATLLCLVSGAGLAQQAAIPPEDAPAHGRPFFMPEWRRQEILELIRTEAWAQEAYAEVQRSATGERANMFWAGFLYALEGKEEHAKAAAAALHKLVGPSGIGWWRGFHQGIDWESERIRWAPESARILAAGRWLD